MSRIFRLVAWGLALLAAQGLLVALLQRGLRPDVVLVFSLAMGLASPRATRALLLAFGIGFAFDALSGSPLGLYALLRGTACAATRMLDRALYLRAPLPWGLYCAAYTLVDLALLRVAMGAAAPHVQIPLSEMLGVAPGAALLTGVAGGLLLGPLRRADVDADREASWRSLASPGPRARP